MKLRYSIDYKYRVAELVQHWSLLVRPLGSRLGGQGSSVALVIVLCSGGRHHTHTVPLPNDECIRMHSLLRGANARNSIRGPVYVINSVDKTKLPCYTLSPMQHHSCFRNLSPIQGEFDIKKTSPEGAQSPNQRKVE